MEASANNSVKYLHPLTVEAHMFNQSMSKYSNSSMDPVLCSALLDVVASIEKFLNKPNQTLIVPTESTILVDCSQEIKPIYRLYHCSQCQMNLGLTPDKVAVHLIDGHEKKSKKQLRKEQKKAINEKRIKHTHLLPKKAMKLMSNDLLTYFGEALKVAEKLKYIPAYDKIEEDLKKLIAVLFPSKPVNIYKFGSRISGIGTINSDLDIFVDIGNSFDVFENRASKETVANLQLVGKAMRKLPKEWKHLVVIDNARVPIIKVLNVNTGLELDIGFSNSLGFCNTKLVEYFFELQPIVRYMCIFLKKWLERTKLKDLISTYSMILMAIFYIQVRNCLPSIEQLQDNCDSVLVGPWISNFNRLPLSKWGMKRIETTPNECKKYLQQCCEYYANFDFKNYIVCPFLGKRIEIDKLHNLMPMRYLQYIASTGDHDSSALQVKKHMVVQDPIQLNHNVTKAVTQLCLKQLCDYMQQTSVIFRELK